CRRISRIRVGTHRAEVPMTTASAHSFSRLSARLRAVLLLTAAIALAAGAATAVASPAKAVVAATVSTTGEPYQCVPNGPAGSQTVYGTYGDASVIGWGGHRQGGGGCLGGGFRGGTHG